MPRVCSSLLLSLILLSAARAEATLIAWDFELLLTNAGTEPVSALFIEGETWEARVVWDTEAIRIQQSTSWWQYNDLIVSAELSSVGKEIRFDVASADANTGSMQGQPAFASDRFNTGLLQADLYGSRAGQPFTAGLSDIRFFLTDFDMTAFDDLELPIDPGPLSQFEVRGLSLDLPGFAGSYRQTNFLIEDISWSVIPEPGTGLLVALGLVGLSAGRGRARRAARSATG